MSFSRVALSGFCAILHMDALVQRIMETAMPRLIRLYIINVLVGFLLSAAFVGLLLWFDVAGLRGLIFGSSAGFIALVMLWVFNGIVFAGVQFSIRIMMMADRGKPSGGKRQRSAPPDAIPSLAVLPVKTR